MMRFHLPAMMQLVGLVPVLGAGALASDTHFITPKFAEAPRGFNLICPAGRYASKFAKRPRAGGTSILNMNEGKALECSDCPAGKFSVDRNQAFCFGCPKGQISKAAEMDCHYTVTPWPTQAPTLTPTSKPTVSKTNVELQREKESASLDTCSRAVQMYCGGSVELNQCDSCIKTYWDELVSKDCKEVVLKDVCDVVKNGLGKLPPASCSTLMGYFCPHTKGSKCIGCAEMHGGPLLRSGCTAYNFLDDYCIEKRSKCERVLEQKLSPAVQKCSQKDHCYNCMIKAKNGKQVHTLEDGTKQDVYNDQFLQSCKVTKLFKFCLQKQAELMFPAARKPRTMTGVLDVTLEHASLCYVELNNRCDKSKSKHVLGCLTCATNVFQNPSLTGFIQCNLFHIKGYCRNVFSVPLAPEVSDNVPSRKAPVITVLNHVTEGMAPNSYVLNKYKPYHDAGITCTDTMDSNPYYRITENNVDLQVAGNYVVKYLCLNSALLSTVATRHVTVRHTHAAPSVTLNGPEEQRFIGSTKHKFQDVDKGASCLPREKKSTWTDSHIVYGSLFKKVEGNGVGVWSNKWPETNGKENLGIPGTYLVKYLCKNSYELHAKAVRTVMIESKDDCPLFLHKMCKHKASTACIKCADHIPQYELNLHNCGEKPRKTFCVANTAKQCSDATKNGDETGVDCGGEFCAPCRIGSSCKANSDCETKYCRQNACKQPWWTSSSSQQPANQKSSSTATDDDDDDASSDDDVASSSSSGSNKGGCHVVHGQWSQCSATCGAGNMYRYQKKSKCSNGAASAQTVEKLPCNARPCKSSETPLVLAQGEIKICAVGKIC